MKSGCHQKEKTWFENEDGPPPNQHRAAYTQLTRDPAKSTKYATSVNLTNPQDPAGRCVECHAPPQRSRFADGVSCEVCHGLGSSYYDPHDDEPYMTNGYPKAQTLGMLPLLGNPATWAQRCSTCHIVREQKLIEAGHPSGDDFDLAAKYRLVASPNGNHWKTNYGTRADEIRRLAKQLADPIKLARAKTAAPVPTPTAPPAPAPATPTPAAPIPTAPPAAAPSPTPAAPATPSPSPTPRAAPAAPRPAPAPPPPAAPKTLPPVAVLGARDGDRWTAAIARSARRSRPGSRDRVAQFAASARRRGTGARAARESSRPVQRTRCRTTSPSARGADARNRRAGQSAQPVASSEITRSRKRK